ncbi:hypothetical protein K1719_029627 [Acacia pycnantha]|nr:hypothetical protein K1719_029627 [Acacia pycnantha]
MQNVALLEEVLSVESSEDNASSALVSNPTSMRNNEMTVQWLKLLLRSYLTRSDSVRNRTRQIVDEGLQKLQKCAVRGDAEEPNEASKRPKTLRTERLSDISDLIDKINEARREEDLKACLEKKSQLFNWDKGSSKPEVVEEETHMKQVVEGDLAAAKELDYSFPKLVVAIEIDQETLNTIHTHFCSLEHVEQL